MKDILKGRLVRLSAFDADEMSKAYVLWSHDSEYDRLLTSNRARLNSIKAVKSWIEKDLEDETRNEFAFSMRTLEQDRLIGDIALDVLDWSSREAFVGLGIGEREFWSKGYGTDAMSVMLRYAFVELNLRRVTLTVFEYNPRAIRSYEKAGFRREGCQRGSVVREGRRWGILYMGIQREDWRKQNDGFIASGG